VLSVAVLTSTGTAGDALDDAFFVLGPKRSEKLVKRNPATEVFFFLPGPNRSWTMVREPAR
jgi:thiamine biosynthesis lipoprotein ApbE